MPKKCPALSIGLYNRACPVTGHERIIGTVAQVLWVVVLVMGARIAWKDERKPREVDPASIAVSV